MYQIQNKVGKPANWDKPPGTYSESSVDVPVKDPHPSWAGIFTSLPQTFGTLAVAAIKFITPKAPADDRIGVNKPSGGRPGSTSVSEVILHNNYWMIKIYE